MSIEELHHLSREELIETVLRLHTHSLYLEEQLTLLKKALFGKKSEKQLPYVDSQQQVLDLDVLSYESQVEKKEEIHYTRKKVSHQVKGHGRNPLPSHLKVEEEVLEPDEKTEEMEKIGEEVSEKIDYKPSEFIIKRIIRPKYKDRETEKIYIAPLPGGPFEKSIAGSGLIAHVNIQKYVDHLPLYRQQQQFKRQGVEISTSTMSDWVRQTAELVEPLYERLKEEVLSSGYVMADETPIRVQDRTKRGETHRGYYWVYYSPERRLVFFDYRYGRGREGPEEILNNYRGILQTDGWTGYEALHTREEIFSVGCMAHARRKFVDARMHHKKLSDEVLGQIQKLYLIERFSRTMNLTVGERYRLRQENAVPILKEMRLWLDYQLTHPTYTPKSTFGQAIHYMDNQWDRLAAYCENGRIEIDNNPVENAIRPIALGRKNYLFAGSHEGAKRAAIIYSLVSSAKLQGIDSFQYLKTILDILPEHSIKRLHELLPGNDFIATLILP